MARVLRGEIYWAELGSARGHEQTGARPVLVISHDVFNARSGTAIVLALTSQPQRAGYPLTLPVASVRLPTPSWVTSATLPDEQPHTHGSHRRRQ